MTFVKLILKPWTDFLFIWHREVTLSATCKILMSQNDIYLDQEIDIALYNDAESMEVSPEILLDDCEVQNNTQFNSVGERSEEMDPFCDVDSDITDVEADSDGEILNRSQQMLNDYFPYFIATCIIFQDPRYFFDFILLYYRDEIVEIKD